MPEVVHDFPFDRLPKLSRAEVEALARARQALQPRLLSRLCATASELLGTQVSATWAGAETCATTPALRARFLGAGVALVFERGAGGPAQRCAVELDTASAMFLVDRMLGSDGDSAVAFAAATLPDAARGVLAYLGARLAALSAGQLVLRDVLTSADALVTLLAAPALTCVYHAHVAGRVVPLRLTLALAALAAPSPDEPPPRAAWLDAVPLSLWADAGKSSLPLMAARTLGVGDIVVLDHSGLVHTRGALHGELLLRIEGSSSAFLCSTQERALRIERLAPGEDLPMTTGRIIEASDRAPEASALAHDAPIELRVELARFTLTLGELGQLAPGDVLVTGRRIGEAVLLRAGGRAIAEGELVDVEGELGVRVLRVLAGDQSAIV